jgi:hypothetical protein
MPQRLREEGPNELGVSQRRTLLDMAWDVVREPILLLLMGDPHEALILPSRSGQLRWRSLWTGLTPTSLWVLGGTLLALVFVTLFPPVARAFGFTVLAPGHWLAALTVGCTCCCSREARRCSGAPCAPERCSPFFLQSHFCASNISGTRI